MLELAYELPGYGRPALAIEMASPRQLERRLLALVDATRRRTVPAGAPLCGLCALLVALVVPISAATTNRAESAQSSTVRDDESVMGLWEIRPASSGFVEVRLCHADLFSRSEVAIRELDGLSLEELAGPERSVRVILRRDAGAFTLDGTAERGNGSGTYTFTPAPTFPSDLERLGFEPPSATMQARWPGLGSWTHTLALYDIGLDFLDSQRGERGASLAWHQIVRIRQHQTHMEAMVEAMNRRPVRTKGWC